MKKINRTLAQVLTDARAFSDNERESRFGLDAIDHGYGLQRSAFETDGDKISFCESFRALADKTQVHDRTGANGYFRNRLTHSMEVSRVGRSLGVAVGARMISFYGLHAAPAGEAYWKADPADIGHVVAAACLAHDLGNPPFGHDGEDSISTFFQRDPTGLKAIAQLGETHPVARELRLHEGNAQGFRMITRTMGWRKEGGLNLTAATLAAFQKYPFTLREDYKKYGVHHADLATLEMVAEATGMTQARGGFGWSRHPLAWLMEAADDICYLTVDIEDAVWLGVISPDAMVDMFRPVVGWREVDEAMKLDDLSRIIQRLRGRMINALINGCLETYPTIAESLDDGSLDAKTTCGGIVGHTRHGEAMLRIQEFSRNEIYRSQETRALRTTFRSAMATALSKLSSEMIAVIERGDPTVLTVASENTPTLAMLPAARMAASVPLDPAQSWPWLLDQVTLMSDARVLEIAGASQRLTR